MKRPGFTRWLGIALRTAHLVCVIVLGAGLIHGEATDLTVAAVLGSGFALFALDTWHYPRHLLELSGLAVLVKLALIAIMALDDGLRQAMFWSVVVWSGVFSHAPAWLRHLRLTRAGWVRK